MNNFIEKWQNDKKYRAKVKLILYTLFVVIVSIYAISLNNNSNSELINDTNTKETNNINEKIINIPDNYNYTINININDNLYKYYGIKTGNYETITKEKNNIITNYIYENNEYYIEDNLNIDNYIKTTKDEVYDIINYNYINLDNINTYLEKSENNNNQYIIYLKDIVLGNDSNDYFVILVNENKINIDYTPLMKSFNNEIKKCKVDIEIEK